MENPKYIFLFTELVNRKFYIQNYYIKACTDMTVLILKLSCTHILDLTWRASNKFHQIMKERQIIIYKGMKLHYIK